MSFVGPFCLHFTKKREGGEEGAVLACAFPSPFGVWSPARTVMGKASSDGEKCLCRGACTRVEKSHSHLVEKLLQVCKQQEKLSVWVSEALEVLGVV